MKPEEKAEIILWDWLKTKSSHVKEVYFNRTNKVNAPTFQTKGISKKPDFLVKIEDGFKTKFYAVEVKSSSKSNNIIQASKILDRYLKGYLDGFTTYLIDGKKITLDGFLIASDSSPKGFLFKDEEWIDNTKKDEGLSKYHAATKYKIIPNKEGSRTFEFIRYLWGEYSKFRNDLKDKLSVGILIGNSEDSFYPHIFITNFDNKKNRWCQRWWKV